MELKGVFFFFIFNSCESPNKSEFNIFILNTRLFFSHQSLFVALLSARPFRRTAPLKHQTSCPYFAIFPNAVKRGRRKWHDCTGNNKLHIIGWFLLSWKNIKKKKLLLQASGCHYFVACQFLPELHEFRGGQTHTLIISLSPPRSRFNSVCFFGMTFNHTILTNHSINTWSGWN